MSARLKWSPWLLAAAVVLGTGLAQTRLMRMDDEGLYVRIAMEMFARHDWTVPTWFGAQAWYKPPGLYWSMFPWFAMLGLTLAAARLATWTWSMLSLVVVAAYGRRAAGDRAGLLAALFLLTACSFYKYARVGMMEAALTFFYVAALYAMDRADREDGPLWSFLWPAVAGASCLIKGPVTAIVLGLTAVVWCAVRRRWTLWTDRATLWGMLPGLALAALWPLMVLARGEWKPWWDFFIVRENFGKFDNQFYSPLNIWGMFLGHAAPWTFLLLAALALIVRRRAWQDGTVALNSIFLLCLLAFFTLPATRLSWYSVPGLPAASLLVALVLVRSEGSRLIRAASLATALLLMLVGFLLGLAPRVVDVPLLWTGLAAAWAFAAAGFLLRQRWEWAAGAVCLIYAGLSMVGVCWKYPFITNEARLAMQRGPQSVIVRLSPYAWSYEFGRLATQVTTGPEVDQALRDGSPVLISDDDLARLGVTAPYRIETRWPALRRRLPVGDVATALRTGDRTLVEEHLNVLCRP